MAVAKGRVLVWIFQREPHKGVLKRKKVTRVVAKTPRARLFLKFSSPRKLVFTTKKGPLSSPSPLRPEKSPEKLSSTRAIYLLIPRLTESHFCDERKCCSFVSTFLWGLVFLSDEITPVIQPLPSNKQWKIIHPFDGFLPEFIHIHAILLSYHSVLLKFFPRPSYRVRVLREIGSKSNFNRTHFRIANFFSSLNSSRFFEFQSRS